MIRRIRRGSATKKDDPDYWETSKPVKRDGMEKTTRFSPVKKEVIYFNFRNEISAFDQIFYFSKYKKDERKDVLLDEAYDGISKSENIKLYDCFIN